MFALTACAAPEPAREPPSVEGALWSYLEAEEFPVCEQDFRRVRDRHECMIDSAWLVWVEAGLEWGPDMQDWAQALLTRTYLIEQQARKRERLQNETSTGMIDDAQWERIRSAGDAAIEQVGQGRNRDWQAGYDQGFDDALPEVEDFNKTYGGWGDPAQGEH